MIAIHLVCSRERKKDLVRPVVGSRDDRIIVNNTHTIIIVYRTVISVSDRVTFFLKKHR